MEQRSVFAGLSLTCSLSRLWKRVHKTQVTDQKTAAPPEGTRFQTQIVLSESHHRPKHWRQLPVTPGRSSKFLNRDKIFCSQNGGVASLSAQATSVS